MLAIVVTQQHTVTVARLATCFYCWGGGMHASNRTYPASPLRVAAAAGSSSSSAAGSSAAAAVDKAGMCYYWLLASSSS